MRRFLASLAIVALVAAVAGLAGARTFDRSSDTEAATTEPAPILINEVDTWCGPTPQHCGATAFDDLADGYVRIIFNRHNPDGSLLTYGPVDQRCPNVTVPSGIEGWAWTGRALPQATPDVDGVRAFTESAVPVSDIHQDGTVPVCELVIRRTS